MTDEAKIDDAGNPSPLRFPILDSGVTKVVPASEPTTSNQNDNLFGGLLNMNSALPVSNRNEGTITGSQISMASSSISNTNQMVAVNAVASSSSSSSVADSSVSGSRSMVQPRELLSDMVPQVVS